METTRISSSASPTPSPEAVGEALCADLIALESAGLALPVVATAIGVRHLRHVRAGRDRLSLAPGLAVAALALRATGASALVALLATSADGHHLDGSVSDEMLAILEGAGQGSVAFRSGTNDELVAARAHFVRTALAAQAAVDEVTALLRQRAAERQAAPLRRRPSARSRRPSRTLSPVG